MSSDMYEHMHVHLHAIYTVLYIVQCSYMYIILHSILNKKNISDKTIYPIVHYIINTVCYIFYYIYPTYMYIVYIHVYIQHITSDLDVPVEPPMSLRL